MIDEVYELLQKHRIKMLGIKISKGSLWTNDERWKELVFTSLDGTPIYYSNINESLKEYVAKINMIEKELARVQGREPKIFKPITCHTFRHTFATRCYEVRVDNKVLQNIMGHGSMKMTDYYTHVTNEQIKLETQTLRILE